MPSAAYILVFPSEPTKVRICFTEKREIKDAKLDHPGSRVLCMFESLTPMIDKWYLFRFFNDRYNQEGKKDVFDIGSDSHEEVEKLALEAIAKLKLDQRGWAEHLEKKKEITKDNTHWKFIESFSRDVLKEFIRMGVLGTNDHEKALGDIRYSINFIICAAENNMTYATGLFLFLQVCKCFEGMNKTFEWIFSTISEFVKGVKY